MINTTTITIDLAKDIFQVAIFNKYGKSLINQAISPKKARQFVTNHPEAVIYMEACGSAHYWGRQFKQLGHKVKLIPPHIVARYRNGNKNDKKMMPLPSMRPQKIPTSTSSLSEHLSSKTWPRSINYAPAISSSVRNWVTVYGGLLWSMASSSPKGFSTCVNRSPLLWRMQRMS
jgi:hypothetical protein